MTDPTVGVVGAGITGLSLTHHLAERGVESVAFETDDEPGGVIRSETVDGRVLEFGPQRTRLTDGVRELVDAAGLGDDLLVADDDLPLYVYVRGRLRRVPFSLRAFLATDLLSWTGKLRVLAEPLTGSVRPEETAAEAFARKFGREAYANLVGPLFGGTYGSDPAEMPAEYALAGLMRVEERDGSLLRPALRRATGGGEAPPPVSFRDGMQQLPRALAGAYADRVRLGTPVEAVRDEETDGGRPSGETGGGRTGGGRTTGGSGDDAGDGRYVLATADGEYAVDEVVLTTPAGETADLLAELAPDAAERLRRLAYNSLVYVHLAADSDRAGFGYQVRRDEPMRTLGVTWNASLLGRDSVYTCFLGGMHDPEAVAMSEADLGDLARAEFERVMDCGAEVLSVRKLHDALPAYDRTWSALDGLELPEGVHLATNYTARMGVPGRIREAARLAEDLAGEGRRRARPA